MKINSQIVSIAETVEDCKSILRFYSRKKPSSLKVVALSLESLEYMRTETKIETLHIWDLIDMENLIHRAYLQSNTDANNLIKSVEKFCNKKHLIAIERIFALSIFFYHISCFHVSHNLKRLFIAKNTIYLVPPIQLTFFSKAIKYHQQNLSNNFIFKAVSADEFRSSGFKVRYINWSDRIISLRLIITLFSSIFSRIFKDVLQLLSPYRPTENMIINYLRKGNEHYDILISGWGSDISRFIQYDKLKDISLSSSKLRIINTIWRPGKVSGYNPKEEILDRYASYVVDEEIFKGFSYGPKLTNFPFTQRFSSMAKYFKIIFRHARLFFRRNIQQFSKANESFSMKINTLYNMFFAYRESSLHEDLFLCIQKKVQSRAYVGSDSDLPGVRASILSAKALGLKTFSVHHGMQAWAFPESHYLGDTILTHGARNKVNLSKSVSTNRIEILGNSRSRMNNIIPKFTLPVKVVVGTRSLGGLWTNSASKHDEYDRLIKGLLGLLSLQDRFHVVIKSHPNGDYHQYYDLISKRYKNVNHIKKGWKDREKGFLDLCDIMVCIGEMPSLFLSAMFFNIPVVFITKTMTKTQRYLHYDYEHSCAIVKDEKEAFKAINRLIDDRTYLKKVVEKQSIFSDGYTAPYPEKKLYEYLAGAVESSSQAHKDYC